jgi:ribonuclease-3
VERAQRLAEQLGLPIRDLALLSQSLTHSSWLHEHPDEASGHNERLEFLGDAVLNLAMSEALFLRHPDEDEGLLSARRAAIVSAAGLATIAERIDLGSALALGEGEAARGGRERPLLLASAFEALSGALMLDLGWVTTRDWILQVATPELDEPLPPTQLKSPKSRLQEYAQQRHGARPDYRLVEATGPDHEKQFHIEVALQGEALGSGVGPSRRRAETAAAAEAIAVLEARLDEDAATLEGVEQTA